MESKRNFRNIQLRISFEDYDLIKKASKIASSPMSAFARRSAIKEAREILKENKSEVAE